MGVVSIRGIPTLDGSRTVQGTEVGAADLSQIPLTAPLSLQARTELAAMIDIEHVGPGYRLARSGGAGYALVILCSGAARLRQGDVVVRRLGPGDWYGSLAGSVPNVVDGTLTTESPVTAFVLDASSWRLLWRRRSAAAERLRERMAALSTVGPSRSASSDRRGAHSAESGLPDRGGRSTGAAEHSGHGILPA